MNELPHLRQGLVIGLNDKPIIEMFNGYVHMVWARCEASHHEHDARAQGERSLSGGASPKETISPELID